MYSGKNEDIGNNVSILIQPEGWMLCVEVPQRPSDTGFNPHPARRLDAIAAVDCVDPSANSFNPHPARRLDAMIMVCSKSLGMMFQSSSSPKAGCYGCSALFVCRRKSFNPHPARRLDAICMGMIVTMCNFRFNPHPARRLDAIDFS